MQVKEKCCTNSIRQQIKIRKPNRIVFLTFASIRIGVKSSMRSWLEEYIGVDSKVLALDYAYIGRVGYWTRVILIS